MKKLLLLAGLALYGVLRIGQETCTEDPGGRLQVHRLDHRTDHFGQRPAPQRHLLVLFGSFVLENEILRAGGPEMDLSEMWIVRNMYFDKGVKYVRLHGHLNFAEGGAAHDVIEGIKKYGIVPQEVYPGLNYGTEKPVFGELDAALKAYLDAVIKARNNGVLTTAWQDGLNALLDTYFGVRPEKFTYEGKEYTPESFAASLPIKMDDYVSIASFTHHPFYSEFIIEVPDNWMWGTVYNVPLEEMMAVVDNAMANNYSIEWSTDVSEKGLRPHQGDRNHSRNRHRRHGGYRGREVGQIERRRERGRPLQVRQTRQGEEDHAGDAPDRFRQLRNYGRPRHGNRGYGRRSAGQSLLQGKDSWDVRLPTTVTTTSRVRSWSTKPCPLW